MIIGEKVELQCMYDEGDIAKMAAFVCLKLSEVEAGIGKPEFECLNTANTKSISALLQQVGIYN